MNLLSSAHCLPLICSWPSMISVCCPSIGFLAAMEYSLRVLGWLSTGLSVNGRFVSDGEYGVLARDQILFLIFRDERPEPATG